jgi:hypothetical protein
MQMNTAATALEWRSLKGGVPSSPHDAGTSSLHKTESNLTSENLKTRFETVTTLLEEILRAMPIHDRNLAVRG